MPIFVATSAKSFGLSMVKARPPVSSVKSVSRAGPMRAPLLDHHLMQHVASMPSSLKLRQRQGKYILKKAMEPILPKEILYRRKQGFAIPLDHWFRKELRDFARPALLESDDGILDPSYI